MSDNVLIDFQQLEAETTARMLQLNRWSQVMIELLIQEQEAKLLASDLPVDEDMSGASFGPADSPLDTDGSPGESDRQASGEELHFEEDSFWETLDRG